MVDDTPSSRDNRASSPDPGVFAQLPAAIVVMGVSGAGKSSVGAALAERLVRPFLDADDFHPPANVSKMARGEPLTDDDRWPWLDLVASAMTDSTTRRGGVVLACSALRRAYRDRLRAGAGEQLLFLHLHGGADLIGSRLKARRGHFMPPGLLVSQFATLEPPGPDERAITVDIAPEPDAVLTALLAALAAASGRGQNAPT